MQSQFLAAAVPAIIVRGSLLLTITALCSILLCHLTSGVGVVCHHGVRPVLRVARTKENHGRQFWGCAHYALQEPCEFFVWADSGLEQEEENEKLKLRRKVANLKMRVKRAERMKNVAVLFALVGWVG
ncbi:hypothetical protein PIB30_006584 [Stylosanthes scabra]|uniref:GRF-type domain-containing protein n=1 Tax=Stylosanthes scabra TaxID=79078 RepID=A0ABU6Y618_9FABA|nr:hypothetical protein [Stylosanthes scabra]